MKRKTWSFLQQTLSKPGGLLGRQQSNILAAAGLIMMSYGLSLILGLLRQRLLGATYYACCAADLDAYNAAFRIPDMIFQVTVTACLSAAFMPTFVKRLKRSRDESRVLASTSLLGLGLVLFILNLIVFIWAEPVSRLITADFSERQIELMSSMMRWMLVIQGIFLFSTWATSILQSYRRFLAPALSPVAYNLGIILGIVFLADRFGIYAAVIGVSVGAGLHLLLQLPVLWQLDYRWAWRWDGNYAWLMTHLSWPRSLTIGMNQIEISLGMFLVTGLSAGSVYLYSLASLLRQVPVQLVGVAIGQAALPKLSHLGMDEIRKFRALLVDNAMQVLYLILPITAIMLILRIPIVRLAFGSPSFSWEATVETGWAVAMFCIAIPAYAITQLFMRAFYALEDTYSPMVSNILGLWAFVIVSLAFIFSWEVSLAMGSLSLGVLGLLYLTRWLLGYVGSTQRVNTQSNKMVLYLMWVVLGAIFVWFLSYRWTDIVEMGRSVNWATSIANVAFIAAISAVIKVVVQVYMMDQKIGIFTPSVWLRVVKLFTAGGLMLICLWIPFQFLDNVVFDTTRVIPLLALTVTTSSIGGAVYLILCHVLQVKEQDLLWTVILRFPGFRRVAESTQSLMEPVTETGD